MAETPKASVVVELYDFAITARPDDRIGKVLTNRSLNEEDLIGIAIQRRTELSASALRSAIEILKEIAKEEISRGASVAFGLGYFSVGVNGVFYGDDPKWTPGQHALNVRVVPTAELRNAVKSAEVNLRRMAPSGAVVSQVIDVTTGELNSRLTPGGGVNMEGTRIRIAGDNPANGIALVNQQTNVPVQVPMTSILLNDPSKVSFIVPADLPEGDYKLHLTTQFSTNSTFLKEPRTYVLEYVLTV